MPDDEWPEPEWIWSGGNCYALFPERWIDVCMIGVEDLKLELVESEDGSRISNAEDQV